MENDFHWKEGKDELLPVISDLEICKKKKNIFRLLCYFVKQEYRLLARIS